MSSFRGAWLGDFVILPGDDSGLPDPGGLLIATSADPGSNRHALARAEFTNISYRVLAELCLDGDTATELAARSKEGESLLFSLLHRGEGWPKAG
jgi:hypothetical protein